MTCPLDYFSDVNGVQLNTVDKVFGVPEYVKLASAAPTDLPETVYADTKNLRYPCHTKAATWLSEAYYLLNQHLYNTAERQVIQGRIVKAAEYFGMEGIISGLESKWNTHNTAPTTKDADYALVVDNDGTKIKRMPVNSPEAVKASAAFFAQNRANYPYEWRKTAARRILAAVDAYKVALDEPITDVLGKSAGYGFADPVAVAKALQDRATLIGKRRTEAYDSTIKLAEASATMIPRPDSLSKIASVIDHVDREYGLTRFYKDGLQMPEDFCFTVSEKQAADAVSGHVRLTTGNDWSLEALSKLPLDKLAGVLGDDFVKAVAADDGMTVDLEKFAAIAPTLPRNDASLLESALNAHG